MNTLASLALVSLALTSTAVAQGPQPIPGEVRDAGTYHVHSQTWTRGSADFGAGSDVIYNNTYDAGYFLPRPLGSIVVDEGRVPSAGGTIAGVNRTEYSVNGFRFAYCTDVPSPDLEITIRFYESYTSCEDPFNTSTCLEPSAVVHVPDPLATTPGSVDCWTMAVDLEGYEFHLEGDGGACSPGANGVESDLFGWSAQFTGPPSSFFTGLIISGDKGAGPNVGGAYERGGAGTYFGPAAPFNGATGLDTQDQFFSIESGTGITECLFFGPNLLASFQMELFASPDEGCAGPICETCEPLVHSGGGQARLTGSFTPLGGLHLECTDGLAGEFCYVLGATQYGLPGVNAFNGRLCLTGTVARYAPVTASNASNGAFNSMGTFDQGGVYQNMAGTSATGTGFDVPLELPPPLSGAATGQTLYFQLWFRDSGAGAVQGLSNVVEVSF